MHDNRWRHMDGAVSAGQQGSEGTAFFANANWRSSSQPHIEERDNITCRFAERHICTDAKAAKGCGLEPERVPIAKGSEGRLSQLAGVRMRFNGLARDRSDEWICKRLEERTQPILIRIAVVIDVGDKVRIRFCQPAVPCTAQPRNWFDSIASAELLRKEFGFAVARGVVDYEHVIWSRLQPGHGRKAIPQEGRAIPSTDDDCDSQSGVLAIRVWD